jgi:hypothetical protein
LTGYESEEWWFKLAQNKYMQHIAVALFTGLAVLTLLVGKRPSFILKAKDDVRVAILRWNVIWLFVVGSVILVLTVPFYLRERRIH